MAGYNPPNGGSLFAPGLPPNERDLLAGVNSSYHWLGALVSNGTLAVDNATTATPFLSTVGQGAGSLAGRGLILIPTTAGFIRPSTLPMTAAGLAPVGGLLVAGLTVPPAVGTEPGILMAANERAGVFFMMADEGWLQWLSSGGAGNLHVFGAR